MAPGAGRGGWLDITPGLYFGLALVGTTVEETLFRGLGIVWVVSRWPEAAGAAIVVTSVLFGLGHGLGLGPVLLHGTIGAVLAVVAIRADSVLPSLTIHLLVNTTLLAVLLL